MKEFTQSHFEKYCSLIYDSFGVHFVTVKKDMLQAKLDKLMRIYNIESYDEYYTLLTNRPDKQCWTEFVDEITVHQSSFFRENNHFEYIRTQLRFIFDVNPRIRKSNEIRVWSAGCSTGEEPYTLAMILKEWLPEEIAVQILATDISAKTIATAQKGVYPANIKKEMDPYFLMRYFKHSGESYEIIPELKQMITFRLFNLMEPFSFQNVFDLIFCRNVMIYFDATVQAQLVEKFYRVLTEGGLFFIGHSESLINKQDQFKYVQPTIYLKEK